MYKLKNLTRCEVQCWCQNLFILFVFKQKGGYGPSSHSADNSLE